MSAAMNIVKNSTKLSPVETAEHTRFWLRSWTDLLESHDEQLFLQAMARFHHGAAQMAELVSDSPVTVQWGTSGLSFMRDAEKGTFGIILPVFQHIEHADAVVGIALHEASHIVYSKWWFNMITSMRSTPYSWISGNLIRKYGKVTGSVNVDDLIGLFRIVLNILEDFRIDEIQYKKFTGYRGYYRSLYRHFYYSPKVLEKLNLKKETLSNYLFQLTFCRHKTFDPTCLNKMQTIIDEMNYPNIQRFTNDSRLKIMESMKWNPEKVTAADRPLMLQTAEKIITIILDTELEKEDSKDKELDDLRDQVLELNWDIYNTVPGESPSREVYVQTKEVKLPENEQLVNKLNKTSIMDMEFVPYRDGDPFKVNSLIFRNYHRTGLGKEFWNNEVDNSLAVRIGINNGKRLSRKLKILGEETPMKFNRKLTGSLDQRRVHALGYEDESIFHKTEIIKYDPVFLDVTVDASGSMINSWQRVIELITALGAAAVLTPKLDVRISLRSTSNSTVNMVTIGVVFDSRNNNMTDLTNVMKKLHCTSSTPEGLAFEAMMRSDLGPIQNRRHYFLNISDGMPGISGAEPTYGGEPAIQHTAKVIKKIKKFSHVLSYYLSCHSGSFDAFKRMYGSSSVLLEPNNLSQIVITLNNLFLEE